MSETASPTRRIVLGICAMDKKTRAKPMQSILSRFSDLSFEIRIFGEEAILDQPIEQWPRCDALLSFFSTGFPLAKAQAYAALQLTGSKIFEVVQRFATGPS